MLKLLGIKSRSAGQGHPAPLQESVFHPIEELG